MRAHSASAASLLVSAGQSLLQAIDNAALELRRKFSVPVVLVVVDTIIVAAQYSEGGDNDTASARAKGSGPLMLRCSAIADNRANSAPPPSKAMKQTPPDRL